MSDTPVGPHPPGPPPQYEEEPVPTWTRDLLRLLVMTFVGILFFTLLILLASTGRMRQQNFVPVEADGVWAGICAGMMALFYPFVFIEHKRRDDGLRRNGLIPLTLLGVVCSGIIVTLVTMTWPLIIGDRAGAGTVAAELSSDPGAVFLVLCFFVGGMAWSMCMLMPMVIGGFKVALCLLVPFLGLVLLLGFAGLQVFDNPPSFGTTVLCAAAAVSGLAGLTVLAALRNVIDMPKPQRTVADREVDYQRFTEDRRRRGLTNENPLPGIDGPQPPRR
ncbi:hypothetical protein [Brevibacterium sp. VCM10]|uniref:hypothetical protein n=1 Tax=Brevibacterium sp. VCM10 TaxID=1381751 RepID=UPI00054ED0D3|nr:hypothetical protein [Brevibacterium sp. VCM10]